MTASEIELEAESRGRDAARDDAPHFRESPLSGEWAGESVQELLGDLIDLALGAPDADVADVAAWLCDAFEYGYTSAADYWTTEGESR
jgi:hypothetical protein